jgi:diguanylate cyclase (GGDEF)-like protein
MRSPVDLRKRKKSKSRESREAAYAAAPGSSAPGRDPGRAASEAGTAVGDRGTSAATPDDTDVADRAEIAEVMYKAAAERAEIAEVMYRAALTRGELAEAREKAAAERAAAIEAREQAAAERDAAVEARERAAVERAAAVEAREQAAAERDSIANARDRAAAERDSIANARDRAAAERDSIASPRLTAGRDDAAEDGDPALERARLEAELQRAHLDSLTGAFRREMGRLALRNEIDRARRADGNFVIAFIDVDGLKGINDRDGHAAGDRVLRTLAAIMRANLRSYDPIVRFGGDEFVCGIASIDPMEVQHRIGVIDQSLRNATGAGITAGLAALTSNETVDELTARADAALIEAKRKRGE